ncbi:hypothetical protein ACFU53_43345 [Streptomyces sp. NPDC057474]|uniref:hypothetical protein n=1 Tax=Streptomyces sp. NPDC057474 TaxID=3346144 RepID=UPI00367C2D08
MRESGSAGGDGLQVLLGQAVPGLAVRQVGGRGVEGPVRGLDGDAEFGGECGADVVTGMPDAKVWEARRKESVRFYTVRAGVSYSLGCHDEWNIFVRLNKARAGHPPTAPVS